MKKSLTVRAARALGRSLAAADALPVKGFPAWSNVASSFDQAGMKLLDANGPNGWKEDVAWVNLSEVASRLAYPNERHVVATARDILTGRQ